MKRFTISLLCGVLGGFLSTSFLPHIIMRIDGSIIRIGDVPVDFLSIFMCIICFAIACWLYGVFNKTERTNRTTDKKNKKTKEGREFNYARFIASILFGGFISYLGIMGSSSLSISDFCTVASVFVFATALGWFIFGLNADGLDSIDAETLKKLIEAAEDDDE